MAYSEDLSLWEPINDEDNPRDEYSLLFKEADLQNPLQSQLFQNLRKYNNSTLNELLDVLISVLQQADCSLLQPIETLFVANKYIEQPSVFVLDDDFLQDLGPKRNEKTTYKKSEIDILYDEASARNRYSQN